MKITRNTEARIWDDKSNKKTWTWGNRRGGKRIDTRNRVNWEERRQTNGKMSANALLRTYSASACHSSFLHRTRKLGNLPAQKRLTNNWTTTYSFFPSLSALYPRSQNISGGGRIFKGCAHVYERLKKKFKFNSKDESKRPSNRLQEREVERGDIWIPI